MSYVVALTESAFPAQADGVVRDLTLGDQLHETAEQLLDKTGLVEADIDGHIGRGWTYLEIKRITRRKRETGAGTEMHPRAFGFGRIVPDRRV